MEAHQPGYLAGLLDLDPAELRNRIWNEVHRDVTMWITWHGQDGYLVHADATGREHYVREAVFPGDRYQDGPVPGWGYMERERLAAHRCPRCNRPWAGVHQDTAPACPA